MEKEIKTFNDLLEILKRRKWSIVIPAAAIFILSGVIAFVIPPTYRSTSTILIEDQEVPRDFVTTTVTGFADQRLQTINQKIMGTTKLLDIINRFNLYGDLRGKWATEDIIEKMRKKDIKFNTISADVIDPRTGQPRPATIAFTLSYEGKNPDVTQKIASELASLYLDENLKDREKQSEGTSKFMSDEMKNVQKELADIDAQISAYKQKNINSLPELAQLNLQAFDSVDREIVQMNDQLRTLKERESYLQSELAAIPTDAANQDKTRLSELRVRLVDLKSHFTDEHPDVIKTKNELAELVKQLRATGRDTPDSKPDSPAYITLSSQLASTRSEIDSVKRQIESFIKKRDTYRKRVESSPGVEEGYKNILVHRNNLQMKFDELSKKTMDARVSQGLEKEQKGERFTVIDAARLPEKPVRPNIAAILLIGLVLGIGSGIGVAAVKEHGDQTAHTSEVLAQATAFPVLATIPEIVTWQDINRLKGERRKVIVGVVLLMIVTPLLVHFLVMDLDIFWAKVMRRMAKLG
ncbi:MAG: lipopolysaccharide biosynthesis [Geobacteraceae bacterium]|nr:MAG: lipopolysaccharide biosynthesis [Geobacteraceae bacterium]